MGYNFLAIHKLYADAYIIMAQDDSNDDYTKTWMSKLKSAFAPASARADAAIAEKHNDPNYNSSGLSDDMKLSPEDRVKKFRKGLLGDSDSN